MPALNLPPADLRLVLDLLERRAPGAEVWAFGSRVDGRSHAGSDLDLVIRTAPDAPRDRPLAAALRSAFAESDLPILVDVLSWTQLPEPFRGAIECAHVTLQPGRVATAPSTTATART